MKIYVGNMPYAMTAEELQALFESAGFKVILAGSGSSAQVMCASYIPDLIILDLGLPDQDGIVFLKKLREESAIPVIVLSARMTEDDKVAALDEGANDYVTKPFGSAELLARVRSALRNSRSVTGDATGRRFVLKDLVIDYDSRRTFLRGEEIKVTQTEYNIIAFLAENRGKMMTYSAIVKAIWGYSSEGSVKKLQVNMANIRRKFGTKPGETSYIINEVGVGYRMLSE